MNKKLKTILVFSVLLVLVVGTTAISANETGTDVSDVSPDTAADTTNTEQTTDESQQTEITTADEQTENETISTYSPNTTSEPQTLMDGFTNDEILQSMAYAFTTGTDSEVEELINALNIMDSIKYGKLADMLSNREQYSEQDFLNALYELDSASQKAVLDVMIAMDLDNQNNNPSPSKTYNYKNKVVPSNVKTSTNANVQSSSSNDIVKQIINAVIPSNNKKTPVNDKVVDDKYDIYLYYLALYTEGKITFTEFIDALNQQGFDTSKIILNPDGSVTYNGETSDVPINQADNTANNETTDQATNDTSTDSTNNDDTSSDSSNNDDVSVNPNDETNQNDAAGFSWGR